MGDLTFRERVAIEAMKALIEGERGKTVFSIDEIVLRAWALAEDMDKRRAETEKPG